MGSCSSKLERQEAVSRCKARNRYINHLVEARHSFAAAHGTYISSLRATAAALLHFANAESTRRHDHLPSPPPPPTTKTTTSLSSDAWTPSTASPPFSGPSSSSQSSTEEESEAAQSVDSGNGEDLGEIVAELDKYFLKAADAGGPVSLLLEAPFSAHSGGKVHHFGKFGEEMIMGDSHSGTVQRLSAWEKKLFHEVKNAERTKVEQDKKMGQLRKLEVERAEPMEIQKTKKEVEMLESRVAVASQAISTTSAEIIKLRDSELYPQLLELVKGLMSMWRGMYESHQVQTNIVQQLKFLNPHNPFKDPTSDIHRQSVLQLKLKVQQWHLSFCNLIKAQRDYILSLTGWLRLSLFQFNKTSLSQTTQESAIYSLCEGWHVAIDRVPDKLTAEGIKSFEAVIHAIELQHAEEYRQKKKSEAAFKELDKKADELRLLENKCGPSETPGRIIKGKDLVAEKRAKLQVLKAKAEEENGKHQICIGVTIAMTQSNLQTGLPHVFEVMTGFCSVCMQAFDSIYSQTKSDDHKQEVNQSESNY